MAAAATTFDELCPYWASFEHIGLTDNVHASCSHIVSPILLLGSGQGLVAQLLGKLGHEVTSVDISAPMVEYARSRRNIDTIFADAASVSLARRFSTVIINTGIVTESNVHTPAISGVLDNALDHLDTGGRIVLAYLTYSFPIQVLEGLGLLGRPSANQLVWQARQSLDALKQALADHGCEAALLDRVFVLCHAELDRHRQLVASVGQAYMRENHTTAPDPAVIDKCGDFIPLYLKRESEERLLNAIGRRQVILDSVDAANGTKIVVSTRQ